MEEQTKQIIIWSAAFSAVFSFIFLAVWLFIVGKIAQARQKKEAEQMQQAFRNLFGMHDDDEALEEDDAEIEVEVDESSNPAFAQIEARQQTRQKPNNIQKPNGS